MGVQKGGVGRSQGPGHRWTPAPSGRRRALQGADDRNCLRRRPARRRAEHNCECVGLPRPHAASPLSTLLPGGQVQAHHGRLQQQVFPSVSSRLDVHVTLSQLLTPCRGHSPVWAPVCTALLAAQHRDQGAGPLAQHVPQGGGESHRPSDSTQCQVTGRRQSRAERHDRQGSAGPGRLGVLGRPCTLCTGTKTRITRGLGSSKLLMGVAGLPA